MTGKINFAACEQIIGGFFGVEGDGVPPPEIPGVGVEITGKRFDDAGGRSEIDLHIVCQHATRGELVAQLWQLQAKIPAHSLELADGDKRLFVHRFKNTAVALESAAAGSGKTIHRGSFKFTIVV